MRVFYGILVLVLPILLVASTPQFDSESSECVMCHGQNDRMIFDEDGTYNSHMVGVMYSNQNILSELVPKESLPPEIKLVDDMVSCISCHDASADLHGILTTTNEYSNLCLSCHLI